MTTRAHHSEPAMASGMKLLAAVLIVAGVTYSLNHGLFLYSTVAPAASTSGGSYYHRTCRYLFASGVVTVRKGGWNSADEAANEFCPLFHQ